MFNVMVFWLLFTGLLLAVLVSVISILVWTGRRVIRLIF